MRKDGGMKREGEEEGVVRIGWKREVWMEERSGMIRESEKKRWGEWGGKGREV